MTSQTSKHKLYEILKRLPPAKFTITIANYYPLASKGQHGYYRGYLLRELSLITGESVNVWHNRLKKLYLKADKEVDGRRIEYVRSTASLSTVDAMQYHSDIRLYAWEKYQVHLREPNDYGPLTTVII